MKGTLALFVCTVVGANSLRAQQDSQLNVGVRSQLDREKNTWNGKAWDGAKLREVPPVAEHGKVYGILLLQKAQEVSGKLVKPVDEAALKAELVRQMDSHGFTHAGSKRRPDILLTVIYGRAHLPNPYFTRDINVDNMGPVLETFVREGSKRDGGFGPDGITVTDPRISNRLLLDIGVRDKATRSQLEKLFILVRAWKNPTTPKEKPEVLWVATMLVDDPDHQDLNAIAKQMLEAGAPFFDKEIKGEEVEIMKPLPDGHVHVGTPEVVEPRKDR